MRKTLKMLCTIAAAMLLLPGGLSAQDRIRQASYQKTDFALARERTTTYKQWVVYNEVEDEYFSFGLLDTSGVNNLFIKTQHPFHVKDMEVYNDILYFCGSMYDSASMTNVGVMGYFPVYSMPTPTVRYIVYDTMSVLKKLDYYKLYTTQHVIMVGTGKDGRDYLVDAHRETSTSSLCFYYNSWNQAWSYMPNIDAKFDDIAMVGDSIVVSARVSDSSVVYLCYMEASPLGCMPFFSGGDIKTKQLMYTPIGRVLLQKAADDTVYAVYRYSNSLAICQFKGSINTNSKKIQLYNFLFNQDIYTILDVAIDRGNKNLGILLLDKGLFGESRRIYHIPTGKVASGGTVYAHVYSSNNSTFQPVSLSRSINNMSVSVGDYDGQWAIAKVRNTVFGNCSTSLSATLDNITKTATLNSKTHEDYYSEKAFAIMPITNPTITVTTVCQ